jgi:tetratricopeptide (TPR) repeat protein
MTVRSHIRALLACAMLAFTAGVLAQVPPRSDPNAELAMNEYREGWQLMRMEQFENAAAAFRRALELNPGLNLAHYGLGRALMALQRYAEAVRSYEACRDNYLAEAGRSYSDQIDVNRARLDRILELQVMQQQVARGPQDTRAQDMQRQVANAIRTTQGAVDRGMNVSVETSVPAFLSLALGSAYFRSERTADAEREYKAAISSDPKSGEAHNNLAVVYFLTGRASLAAGEIKAAEKVGFRVNPDLKDRVKEAMGR